MSRFRALAPVSGAWAAVLVRGGYAFFGWQLVTGSRQWWPDFIAYYTGGRLAWTGHGSQLYDLPSQYRIESQVTGVPLDRLIPLPYDNPPHMALLMAPLSALPYQAAYAIWVALALACFVAGLVLLCRALGFERRSAALAVLVALTFYPVFVTVLRGQVDGLLFLVLAGSLVAWRDGRDAAAGGWLGVALVKFHVVAGLPLLLLARLRRRAIAGLAAVAAFAVLAAAIAFGPAVWLRYVQLLLPVASGHSQGFAHAQAISYSVYGLVDAVGLPRGAGFAIAALAAAAFVVHVRTARRDAELEFGLAVVLSILVSPHQGLQDLALLLLPALVLVRRAAAGRLPFMAVPALLFAGIYAVAFLSAGGDLGWLLTLLMAAFGGFLTWLAWQPVPDAPRSGTQAAPERLPQPAAG